MAGPSPIYELGGVVLEGRNSYDFPLQYGSAPAEVRWTVTNRCAEQFEDRLAQPLDMRISTPEVEHFHRLLYVLEILPGDKFTKKLRVVDLRWRWPYTHIASNFNVRRTTGETFLVVDQGPPSLRVADPDLIYEPTTLFPFGQTSGGRVWGFKDLMLQLISGDPEAGEGLGEAPVLDFDDFGIPVEDFFVDDPGDAALEKALQYGPGIDLYISRAGGVVVTDTRDPEGELVAQRTRPGRLATGPESLEVDRSGLRPSKIVHLFTPEPEVRFDFLENDDATALDPNQDDNTIYNVATVTDESVTIGGRKVARGSIALLLDLFTAWGAFGRRNLTLSLDHLRRLWLEHSQGRLENTWGYDLARNVDAKWLARILEVRRAWRKKFLIDRVFFGRLGNVTPVRVAILNPETGRRAEATVYSDYIRRPSQRGLVKNAALALGGAVVEGHDGGAITAATEHAPVRVSPVNSSGVFELNPLLNPDGTFDQIVLGYPEDGVIPTIDGGAQANRTGNAAYRNWAYVDLVVPKFDLSVIMTVTPATPQSNRRFYAIEKDVPGGKGPPLYSRIYPGVMTARFAWSDAQGDQILDAIRGESPAGWQGLSNLLVDADHLENVAQANQARILDVFRDRTMGGHDVRMDPDLEPRGSLGQVRHIMADGAMVSQLRWVPARRPSSLWRYLDPSTRLFIQGALGGYPRG